MHGEHLARSLIDAKILFPERAVENIDLERLLRMSKEVVQFQDMIQNDGLLFTTCIKLIFPEKFYDIHFDDYSLKNLVEEYARANLLEDIVKLGIYIRILCPGDFFRHATAAKLWEAGCVRIERTRNLRPQRIFVRECSVMRALFPEKFQAAYGNSLDWEKIRKYAKEENPLSLELALALKLLAAKRVKIPDAGVEIIMQGGKKDFQPQASPLPEFHKF